MQASFVIDPEVIPGRMALLITLFLVLINIFNNMSSNSPHSESGFTAVSSWLFACIMFVFSALAEYTMILYKLKNKTKVQFLYNLILYKLGFNLI